MKDGGAAPADAAVRIVSGALEGSNVSTVEAMVKMIELQRQYEMQVKMMKTAKEDSSASDQLLRLV
jgi:flagellar basal-body rod protein FlgF